MSNPRHRLAIPGDEITLSNGRHYRVLSVDATGQVEASSIDVWASDPPPFPMSAIVQVTNRVEAL